MDHSNRLRVLEFLLLRKSSSEVSLACQDGERLLLTGKYPEAHNTEDTDPLVFLKPFPPRSKFGVVLKPLLTPIVLPGFLSLENFNVFRNYVTEMCPIRDVLKSPSRDSRHPGRYRGEVFIQVVETGP